MCPEQAGHSFVASSWSVGRSWIWGQMLMFSATWPQDAEKAASDLCPWELDSLDQSERMDLATLPIKSSCFGNDIFQMQSRLARIRCLRNFTYSIYIWFYDYICTFCQQSYSLNSNSKSSRPFSQCENYSNFRQVGSSRWFLQFLRTRWCWHSHVINWRT